MTLGMNSGVLSLPPIPIQTPSAVRPPRLLALLVSAAVLGGCASFSPDGGFAAVEKAAKDRLGKDLQWARTDVDQDSIAKRVSELLAKPLTVDDTVQVALLNNRGLQATFQDLGIGEAEVVQAGRLPNPGFSFGRSSRGDEREIERGLHFNLARLIAMPFIGHEFTSALPDPARFKADASPGPGSTMPAMAKPTQDVEVKVRKPAGGHSGH